jgi:Rod binding domain-containing protein
MDISPLKPHVQVADLPIEQLAGNKNISEADKVGEVCRQFEAVLLRQILQETRKTVVSSSVTEDSNASGIYNDMINNQLADSISKSGAFGLAKSLQAQLTHQVLPGKEAAQAKAGLTPTQKLTLNHP